MTYTPPTPAEFRSLLARWSLTGAAAATQAGVVMRQIRRYTGGQTPVPYAVLYTLVSKQQGIMISVDGWRGELEKEA